MGVQISICQLADAVDDDESQIRSELAISISNKGAKKILVQEVSITIIRSRVVNQSAPHPPCQVADAGDAGEPDVDSD